MSTENIVKHLRVLWRTDRIIADIKLRHLLAGMGLRAFAALIAAFGLLMLELSAYFALVQIWSAIAAAAILGVVNFALAAVLLLAANRPPSGRDIELANEIHDASIEALQREACALQAQVAGAVHHPLSTVVPVLIPLIAIIVKNLRSAAKGSAAGDATASRGVHS
ncbi:phage holin family protein [Bradyrhizobium sp.]|uniref:phage holin family protein n=1 Tax=Bradyrhizobium sp. TaxID=376 RepID=UPI0039E690D4